MDLISRFFGKAEGKKTESRGLVANPKIENPLSLQLLFVGPLSLNGNKVANLLRAYHPSLQQAQCEIDLKINEDGTVFGIAGWGNHIVRMVGFNAKMPSSSVEACVAPAHYRPELKQQARAHDSHLILYYSGYDMDPLEQYVALAAMAGALSKAGAIVILNESAQMSFPARALSGEDIKGDMMDILHVLPLLHLYCGFVKGQVPGVDGVWMRTYGAHRLGLPDFAAHAAGTEESQRYFEIFENIIGYLLGSKAVLADGHTMQIEDEEFLKLRNPTSDEKFLESDGKLFVAEIITAAQINIA